MRKTLGALVALASLSLVGLSTGSAGAAVPAGYGADPVQVSITGATLIGGKVVNVKIAATRTDTGAPVVCNSVSVTTVPDLVESFSGGGAASYDINLKTEVVDEETPTTVTVVCNYTPIAAQGSTGTASATTASLPAVSSACGTGCVTNSNTIVLLPLEAGSGSNSGILPTTGTEIGLWLLVAGGVLVVGGVGVAIAARRRNA